MRGLCYWLCSEHGRTVGQPCCEKAKLDDYWSPSGLALVTQEEPK